MGREDGEDVCYGGEMTDVGVEVEMAAGEQSDDWTGINGCVESISRNAAAARGG